MVSKRLGVLILATLRMMGGVPVALSGLLAILVAAPTLAEDPVLEDWQFAVTPYLWMLSLDGDVTVKG